MRYLLLLVLINNAYAGSSRCERAFEEDDRDLIPLCLKINQLKKKVEELEAEQPESVPVEPQECPVVETPKEETKQPIVSNEVTKATTAYLMCLSRKWHKDPKTDCSAQLEAAKKAKQKYGF